MSRSVNLQPIIPVAPVMRICMGMPWAGGAGEIRQT
jgi:hypothetical protein